MSLFFLLYSILFSFNGGRGGYWTVVEENFGAGNPWARLLVRSVYGGGPLSFVLYCVELLRIAVPPPPTRTSQAAAAQHFVESSKTLDKLLSLFFFFRHSKEGNLKKKKEKIFYDFFFFSSPIFFASIGIDASPVSGGTHRTRKNLTFSSSSTFW